MSKTNKIDVVYVLGTGSNWQNNELRLSIRSVAENLKDMGSVFVVGEDPGFLKYVTHVYYPDDFENNNADANIINKLLHICELGKLSENFLVMADDSFILSPVKAANIPHYTKGDLKNFNQRPGYFNVNIWRQRLGRTKDILIMNKLSTWHFDCHLPFIVNKKKFVEIFKRFDYASFIGYTWKSIYGNAAMVHPELLKSMDYSIFLKYTDQELQRRLSHFPFMSVNDGGLTENVKAWLQNRFPNPCKFEKK